jgi:hypothetical protein
VRVSGAVVLTACVLLAGCQTLTEELPSQTSSTGVPIPHPPIVVVPVPIPDPEAPTGPPVVPPSETQPVDPPPTSGGPPGQIPNNTNPVTKVGAKVFFIECDGQQVPDSEFATKAQVGCRIHFDCTPKDANNNPTQAQSSPTWTFSPGGLVQIGNVNDFTPAPTAVKAGNLTAYVVIDGVTSNSLNIELYD